MIKLIDILNEINESGDIAYHRSNADFDKFDFSKTESGFGMNRLGWGMYFSQDENLDKKYGDILYKVKFNVPAGKKWVEDYITYDETLRLLKSLNKENEIDTIFDGFEKQRGKKLSDPVIRYLVTGYFDKSTYGDFGKDFAEFLMRNGYIGKRTEGCKEGTCYIVFNPDIIQILNKEKI